MLNLPCSNPRSKYINNLLTDTIYLDPRNNHIYQVVEKRVNNSLLKVAYNYVGNEEAVVLDDVPDSMFRLENPIEVNPSKLLKGKIFSLKEKCQSIMRHRHKSL